MQDFKYFNDVINFLLNVKGADNMYEIIDNSV